MKILLALLLLIPSLSWGIEKEELKEELKYWKSLFDDNLISLEDYNKKKDELLNFTKSEIVNNSVSLEFNPTHTVKLQTNIYKSTDGSVDILTTLNPGEELQYLEDEIYYHRVLLKNGLIGYITNNDLDYGGVKKMFIKSFEPTHQFTNTNFVYDKKYIEDNDYYAGKAIKVEPGTKVEFIGETDNWTYLVKLEDGTVGHVKKNIYFGHMEKLSSNEILKSYEEIIVNQVNIPKTSYGCTNIENTRFPIYSSC